MAMASILFKISVAGGEFFNAFNILKWMTIKKKYILKLQIFLVVTLYFDKASLSLPCFTLRIGLCFKCSCLDGDTCSRYCVVGM